MTSSKYKPVKAITFSSHNCY